MVAPNLSVTRGLLASRVFELADQHRFAAFSGDFNPMHLDALAVRRTQAGRLVVQGMHQLLWALEHVTPILPARTAIRGVRARFKQFLFVDELANLSLIQDLVQQEEGRLRLGIVTKGIVLADIAISVASGDPFRDLAHPVAGPESAGETCKELRFEDLDGLHGELAAWSRGSDAQQYFPGAAKSIGGARVNAIAALSRLVGMVSPGLHSILSAVDLRLADNAEPDVLRYAVSASDRRFSHVRQRVTGLGIEGTVEGYLRRPPVAQASLAEIAPMVGKGEFAGTVALVVGASRGLGQLIARLIAAGGGHVMATYCVGRAECDQLAAEISAFGQHCEVLPYDARRPAAEQLQALPIRPSSVYYCATAKIFGRPGPVYDAARFREFTQVYVDGFYDLCSYLRPGAGQRLSVVYPSSIAVENRPADMTAYAMAKAAGEILCTDISRFWPEVTVLAPRLPRLATDQTAMVATGLDTPPPAAGILLPIIRQAEHSRRISPTP